MATRSTNSGKTPISYKKQLQTSYNEDDRASDRSYSPESEYTDTDETTSDEQIPDKPHAPILKYLNPSPLPSSPHHPNNQTHSTPEPYSSPPTQEPYSSPPTQEPYSSNSKSLNILTEPYSSEVDSNTTSEPDSPDVSQEDITSGLPELSIIPKGSNIQVLKDQTKADPTLKTVRGLAHHNKNGYAWEDGLLVHMTTDHTPGERKRLVIPKPQRQPLMVLAHDKSGHFSITKTKSILNNKFTWPGISTDVKNYIMSCDTCKKFNKNTHKQAPYHSRPVISEPYDEIALDIIGPLPRSKKGYRFALTAICMASRWPEVYPLNNTEAESIVYALVEFISRNGIPSKILTDQELNSHLASWLKHAKPWELHT